MELGQVISIQIVPEGGAVLAAVDDINAIAGKGLEGDRYFLRTGTYSNKHDESREATIIEAEAMEALAHDYGYDLDGPQSRRNITTRGIALNHLVGRTFHIGEAVFKGIRLCEPCDHLEETSGKKVIPGLVHRGGLRAQILVSGQIHVGDPIRADE